MKQIIINIKDCRHCPKIYSEYFSRDYDGRDYWYCGLTDKNIINTNRIDKDCPLEDKK